MVMNEYSSETQDSFSLCIVAKVTNVFIAGRTLLRLVLTLLESSGRFDRKPIILPSCARRMFYFVERKCTRLSQYISPIVLAF